mgnify:CR=1 FL=1
MSNEKLADMIDGLIEKQAGEVSRIDAVWQSAKSILAANLMEAGELPHVAITYAEVCIPAIRNNIESAAQSKGVAMSSDAIERSLPQLIDHQVSVLKAHKSRWQRERKEHSNGITRSMQSDAVHTRHEPGTPMQTVKTAEDWASDLEPEAKK